MKDHHHCTVCGQGLEGEGLLRVGGKVRVCASLRCSNFLRRGVFGPRVATKVEVPPDGREQLGARVLGSRP